MGIIHRGQWDGNKWQSSPSQGKVHLNALATQGHCSDRPYQKKNASAGVSAFQFWPENIIHMYPPDSKPGNGKLSGYRMVVYDFPIIYKYMS